MLVRDSFVTREQWLTERQDNRGIGASEAAAVVGLSPWMTASELFEIKSGLKKPGDISGKKAVERGIRMEDALRTLFAAEHPEYRIEHYPFDILYQDECPFMFATLDGEITSEGGRQGILEIKTSSPNGKEGWEKWNEQIPKAYYCQVLHQLAATGYSFVVLYACLYNRDSDKTIRSYEINREDVQEDIDWLTKKEKEFWTDVQNKTIPPMTLII